MSVTEPRHHPDINPAEDLAFERETLDESIKHDYSTPEMGIVPLNRRRPMWHFMGLWTTFVAGFSYMFLGFDSRFALACGAFVTLLPEWLPPGPGSRRPGYPGY